MTKGPKAESIFGTMRGWEMGSPGVENGWNDVVLLSELLVSLVPQQWDRSSALLIKEAI